MVVSVKIVASLVDVDVNGARVVVPVTDEVVSVVVPLVETVVLVNVVVPLVVVEVNGSMVVVPVIEEVVIVVVPEVTVSASSVCDVVPEVEVVVLVNVVVPLVVVDVLVKVDVPSVDVVVKVSNNVRV